MGSRFSNRVTLHSKHVTLILISPPAGLTTMWGVFISLKKSIWRFLLFYPMERHKLLFPCCTPKLFSNVEMRMNSVLWFLTIEKVAAYFHRGLAPNSQTETIQGATLSLTACGLHANRPTATLHF